MCISSCEKGGKRNSQLNEMKCGTRYIRVTVAKEKSYIVSIVWMLRKMVIYQYIKEL